jgi:hypothetical protein
MMLPKTSMIDRVINMLKKLIAKNVKITFSILYPITVGNCFFMCFLVDNLLSLRGHIERGRAGGGGADHKIVSPEVAAERQKGTTFKAEYLGKF